MSQQRNKNGLNNLPLEEVRRKILKALSSDRKLSPELLQKREDFRKWLERAKPGPEDYDLVLRTTVAQHPISCGLRNPDVRCQEGGVHAFGMHGSPGG